MRSRSSVPSQQEHKGAQEGKEKSGHKHHAKKLLRAWRESKHLYAGSEVESAISGQSLLPPGLTQVRISRSNLRQT